MPKVSVIVPIYNVEKYISKCIESIKNQTLTDFECLLVNDGTPDYSIEVAKEVFGNDQRFKILNKENGGLSDARNFGLKHANGEYVFFLDSDDYIADDTLELAYKKAIEHDSDICVFDMMYVWPDREEVSVGGYIEVTSFSKDKNIIFINNSANNKFFKREFLNNKEFIKGMWYEDLAIIPVWLAKANNVSYVNKPLYYYIQRDGSISHSADPRIFDIYKATTNIKEQLNLTSKDLRNIYFDNCLVMTTLRIRDIEDKSMRKSYYLHNVELLDLQYPNWYKDFKNEFNLKQRIIYTLLKLRLVNVLDWIY